MKVQNLHVAGLIERFRRFRYETNKAVSANLADLSEADLTRARSYLADVSNYLDYVTSRPELDTPASSPMSYELGEPDQLTPPENSYLQEIMRMYEILEAELGETSQSSRRSTGLHGADAQRARDLIEQMGNFLDYAEGATPLDLPESTPSQVSTGPGRPAFS